MSKRVLAPRRRVRVLCASVASALGVLAAVASQGSASAGTAGAATVSAKLSATPLGMNVAPWDALYAASGSGSVLQSLLKNAGVRQLRYGGGVTADYYDWQTNTDIGGCAPNTSPSMFTAKCATHDALGFSLLSKRARAIGAQSFVTVNYGSGSPAEAAAWVKTAKHTAGDAVSLWEIGNEGYGCWEVNNELAKAPEFYAGYQRDNGPTCPMVREGLNVGMQTMAKSYAANAKLFMTAMKAQNPNAQIGVPFAFGTEVDGSSVGDSTEWNNVVLSTDAKYVGFVDVHYYPFSFGGNTGGANPTDQQVLRSLFRIPSLYAEVRAELKKYTPSAKIVIGETGVTYQATTMPCTAAGALFAAGDALSWLASGAQGVDWWQINSYGNTGTSCINPDEGMFTSAAKPQAESPYAGYLLASKLAQPNAQLKILATSDPADVMAFQSVLPGGKVVVALINTNTAHSKHITFKSSLSGKLTTLNYKASNQNAMRTKIVAGRATASAVAAGVTLPAESMLVFMPA